MKIYNWQKDDWKQFSYSTLDLETDFMIFSEKTGLLTGLVLGLPEDLQMETVIDRMVIEAIKTSEIEGEYLSRKDVLSSIKKNLGLAQSNTQKPGKKAEGISNLMIDLRNSFKEPLSKEKLFQWHRMILADDKAIDVGCWRTHEEPMQVISGASGKIKVHFEAPPSTQVSGEMDEFILWFNQTAPGGKKEIKQGIVRSAIAHLYFESIHPFEDGNGRIGRAISEKVFSQALNRPILFSLSRAIEENKNEYYKELEEASKFNEITQWITYFVKTTIRAQIQSEKQIEFTIKKVKFFDRYKDQLSDRQLIALKRMLDEGSKGFEGGMNARKYVGITKVSKATATRDLQDLYQKGVLIPIGAGRSTRYEINL